jgi:Zn-dependent peptidase ImmA (M78 family)
MNTIHSTSLRRESFEEETAERFQISIKAADRIARDWSRVTTPQKNKAYLAKLQNPRRSLGNPDKRTRPDYSKPLKLPPVSHSRYSV